MIAVFQKILKQGLGVPILVVMLLLMVILPLPPFALDLLFTFNIALSLLILLASIYCERPLDFAIFPSVLLIATLLRLALNIASTRVVLLYGHTGTDAAGKVIEAFGAVVVGGNYAVGLVVFAILVIINFVVVTKGAGRISEVSARFTLDAMPGKQMAIDADLNAGIINQAEARTRRRDVELEADFYGAMDGASKFVRGDAVAGILILFINIIGGLLIGMLQHDMAFAEAVHNYTLLMIGDGLVAQVPSLLLSTAAALMVTRVSSTSDMGGQVLSELFEKPKTLAITGIVLAGLGVIPGMPHVAFLMLAIATGGGAFLMHRKAQMKALATAQEKVQQQEAATVKQQTERKELGWEDVKPVDPIGLEVGYRIIPLVDATQGGKLMERIKGARKKLSQNLGFLIPSVHIRDNLDLQPGAYRISLMGVPVGEAEVQIDYLMAINPGQVFGKIDGMPTKDPAFGLEALWIQPDLRDKAQSLGFTVVDPATVIATHLNHIMQEHAAELLGHEEVQQILDRLKETTPKLVDTLVPDVLPLATLVRVMQNLLSEGIPVRDMRTIAETLAEVAPKNRDPDFLTSQVRIALKRLIVQNINGMKPDFPVITLSPELEQLLLNSLKTMGEEGIAFEPGLAEKLQQSIAQLVERQEASGQPAVLLVPGQLRILLARFTRYTTPNLHVLSYQEVPDNKQLKVVGTVGQKSK